MSEEEVQDSTLKVLVRVRPFQRYEEGTRRVAEASTGEGTVRLSADSLTETVATFDQVFSSEQTQREVFEKCREKLGQVLAGFNVTVFAYGQTGSGKTYTMFGRDWESVMEQEAARQ
jgi:hypothetical protein